MARRAKRDIDESVGAIREMALAMTELVQEIRQERHKREGTGGLSDFQKNNLPTFKGGYNRDGA